MGYDSSKASYEQLEDYIAAINDARATIDDLAAHMSGAFPDNESYFQAADAHLSVCALAGIVTRLEAAVVAVTGTVDQDSKRSTAEPVYNVYALWEGTVINEQGFASYDDAVKSYHELVARERRAIDANPDASESSVHLYDTILGNMVFEITLVPQPISQRPRH